MDVLEEKRNGVLSITFAGYYLATTTNEDEPSVFTPDLHSNNSGCKKEFAIIGFPLYNEGQYVLERDPDDSDPSKTRKVNNIGPGWLAKNGYFTCETAFGDLLQAFMEGSGDPYRDPDFASNAPNADPDFDHLGGNETSRYPFKIYSRRKQQIDEMENEFDQEMIG